MDGHQQLTVDVVQSRLRRFDLRQDGRLSAMFPSNQYPHIRRCATLVPLFFTPHDHELHVLLTQRAATLRWEILLMWSYWRTREEIDKG